MRGINKKKTTCHRTLKTGEKKTAKCRVQHRDLWITGRTPWQLGQPRNRYARRIVSPASNVIHTNSLLLVCLADCVVQYFGTTSRALTTLVLFFCINIKATSTQTGRFLNAPMQNKAAACSANTIYEITTHKNTTWNQAHPGILPYIAGVSTERFHSESNRARVVFLNSFFYPCAIETAL